MASILNAGAVALVSYETDLTIGGTADALRIVLLTPVEAGTVLYFTNRGWAGSAFSAAGANEGTVTVNVATNQAAGTIITVSSATLSAAGIVLNNAGDTLYGYQGTDANTPTRFLFAADIADGNTTFSGNLSGTGLTEGINAVAVPYDNGLYLGTPTGVAATTVASIANKNSWYSDDDDDSAGTSYTDVIDTTVGGPLLDGYDFVLLAGLAGGNQSESVLRIGGDDASNTAVNIATLFRDRADIAHIEDVAFDLESGYFFLADTDGNSINRILRGNIADLVTGNQNAVLTQIFATDGFGEIINGIEVDRANDRVYWWDGDADGNYEGGWQLNSVAYSGGAVTQVAVFDFGDIVSLSPFIGIGDWALYGNSAYFVTSFAGIDGLGNATVYTNHIASANLTTGAVTIFPLDNADPRSDDDGGNASNGRLITAEGQIYALDVDQNTGIIYFITQPVSSTANGGIFSYNPATDDLTELWNQPTPSAYSTLQNFPTGNMTKIEVDEVGGRLFITATGDVDSTDGAASDDYEASIFTLSTSAPLNTAPALFARVFNPVTPGGPTGMEIDYDANVAITTNNATYTETAGANSAAGSLVTPYGSGVITDPDNTMLYGAQVAITSGFVLGDKLNFSTAGGISGSYDNTTGVVSFTGLATIANYQIVINSIGFTNAGDNPTNYGANTTRTISVNVFDGLTWGDLASVTLNVVGINDAPINTVGGTLAIAEDAAATPVTGISIADADADPASHDVTVTLAVAHGTIAIRTDVAGGITAGDITGGAQNSSQIVITATQNEINATLANATGLKYTPTADFNGADALTVTTKDAGHTGTDPGLTGDGSYEQDVDTKTITISAVNDAPTRVGDGIVTATTINEDAPGGGQTVSSLFSSKYSDAADNQYNVSTNPTGSAPGSFSGIAIYDNDATATEGKWEFYNGASWVAIPAAASLASATLISSSTLLRFNPAADYNGAIPLLTARLIDNSLGFGITDGQTKDVTTAGGTTAYSTDPVTLGGTVAAVNDAPAITVPGAKTVNEDSTLTINTISVSDVDVGNGLLTVNLGVVHGTISLSGTTGLSFTAGDGTDDSVMTFKGTQTNVNTALNGLKYTPNLDFNGADGLSITVNDNGNFGTDPGATGDGSSEEDTDLVSITVTPINDVPIVQLVASASGDEQTPILLDSTATIRDVELDLLNSANGDYDGATLTLVNNLGAKAEDILDFGPSASFTVVGNDLRAGGLDFATFSGGNGSALVISFNSNDTTATTALVNAVIRSVRYTFNGDEPPATVDIVATIDDGAPTNAGQGGGGSPTSNDVITVTINNTPENFVPVIDLDADNSSGATGNNFTAATFTENSATGVLIAGSDTVITDVETDAITAATITVKNSVSGDQLILGPVAGATVTGSGTTTLSIIPDNGLDYATLADIIEQVKFLTTSDNPGASRTILTKVSDAFGTSTAAETVVAITQINDAPLGTDNTIVINEDAQRTLTLADFPYSDAENHGVENIFIDSITGGTLLFNNFPQTTPLQVSRQQIVDGFLSFQPTLNANGPGTTVLTFRVMDDGGNANGGSPFDPVANTLTVDILPVNDAPTGADKTVTINEDTSYTIQKGDFGFNDPVEGNAFAGVVITTLPGSGDLLLNNAAFLAGTFVTEAQITAGNLKYVPPSNANGSPTSSFTFQVRDDGGTANTGVNTDQSANSFTFNVTAVNDAPSFANFDNAPTFTEGGAPVVFDNNATIFDPELSAANNFAGSTLTLSRVGGAVAADSFGASGTLSFAGSNVVVGVITVGSFTQSGGALVITFNANATQTLVNSTLQQLTYANTSDNPPSSVQISFLFSDQNTGGQGTGPTLNALYNATVNITGVNDAPVGIDSSVTGSEDDPYVFTVADFKFSDAESNALLAVKIATVPAPGTLFYDADGLAGAGAPITYVAGTSIAASDITAGRLYFRPVADKSGSPYASFTFQVQDNGGGDNLDATPNKMTINILPDNIAPVAVDDALTIAEDATTIFTAKQIVSNDTDADGDTLAVGTVLNATNGKAVLNGNGTVTFTPDANFNGKAGFDYQVVDGKGGVDLGHVTVTVTPVNDPPVVANEIPNQPSPEDTAWTFQVPAGSFTDVDGDTLIYSATLSGGAALPAWLSFDAASGTFSGTPPQDFNGNIDIEVTASDGTLSASDIFRLVVTPVNDTPVVAVPIPDQSSPEDTSWNFVVPAGAFTDVDGDTLTYSATLSGGAALPSWLKFNAATHSFSGKPPFNFNGAIDVTVTASDGALSASDTFKLTITPVNDAPQVAVEIADQTSPEDTAWSFQVPAASFTDVDGDTLTYSAGLAGGGALPAWLAFNAATRTFSGTPPLDFNGFLDLSVTASDGALSVSDNFRLTITPVNDAPRVGNPIADQTSPEDTAWVFQVPVGALIDVDGDKLTFSASLGDGSALPSWLTFIAGSRSFVGTPPRDYNGAIDLKVSASDGTASISDIFKLTITPVNDAPVIANPIPDQTSPEDTPWNYQIPAGSFTDVDGDVLTYTAALANGSALPAWLTFNAATRTFSGTPPLDFNGFYDIRVTASDGTLSANDVFRLAIPGVNDGPVLALPLADQTSPEDTPFAFTIPAGSFTDVDGDTLAYSARLADGGALPAWLKFNPSARSFTGMPPLNYNGSLDILVTAKDAALSASDVFTLTISPVNDAPFLISPLLDQTVREDTPVSFQLPAKAFSDIETPLLAYTAALANGDGLPAWLSFDGDTLSFTGTPPQDFNGFFDIRVTASDGSLSANDVFRLTVTPVNDAPVLALPLIDRTSPEDAPVAFQIPAGSFTDVDNPTLTYAATLGDGSPLPAWLVFDAATRSFAGTPPANFNGAIDIAVTASDASRSASDVFRLIITPVNDAPVVAATLAITTDEDVATGLVPIGASDVDGDTLSYAIAAGSGPAKGSVAFNAGGFTYPPGANANGADSFKITVSDGKGGTAQQQVNVTIAPVADAPVVSDEQALATLRGTALVIDVKASDADGDTLTFAATSPANGTLAAGADGRFTYTPTNPSAASDSFTVTVTDSTGLSAQQTVSIAIVDLAPADDWSMFAQGGFTGEIGGTGSVFGTNEFQDISVLNLPGIVNFDPSFNRGGDIIRLDGNAADWTIVRQGSSALLSDGDSFVVIPAGGAGTPIVFDDGARVLAIGAGGIVIGGQTVTDAFLPIDAPASAAPGTGGASAAASARLFFDEGASATAGGRINAFGTDGEETLTLTKGIVTLDPSFNRGGDSLILQAQVETFTAQRSGSSVILKGSGYDVTIPAGSEGMTLAFADGERELIASGANILIGSQIIGGTPVQLTDFA